MNRINVRYYDENGKYFDHGGLIGIGGIAPSIGDVIAPFMGKDGPIKYKVTDVKIPDNDVCIEVYCVKLLSRF